MPKIPTNPDEADILVDILRRLRNLEMAMAEVKRRLVDLEP